MGDRAQQRFADVLGEGRGTEQPPSPPSDSMSALERFAERCSLIDTLGGLLLNRALTTEEYQRSYTRLVEKLAEDAVLLAPADALAMVEKLRYLRANGRMFQEDQDRLRPLLLERAVL